MHKVKCIYCGKIFDRDKYSFVQVSTKRYAHIECSKIKQEELSQIEKDKQALNNYILKLLNIDHIDAKINKQIKTYIETNNYTYSGILKSLIYFYEVKGNSVNKANGGIGIVPYIYQEAFRYYYALWEAQQRNEDKIVEEYVPTVKEIIIPPPERKIKKRKLFMFLDLEEESNGE